MEKRIAELEEQTKVCRFVYYIKSFLLFFILQHNEKTLQLLIQNFQDAIVIVLLNLPDGSTLQCLLATSEM